MNISVFVPSHITGFFNIENNVDYLKNGSCGAGFLLNKGVITSIKESSNGETSIKINGKKDLRNQTIILEVLKLLNIDYPLNISQEIQVPIGAGFGTSAASALGVAISLSEFFDLNHDFIESGKIAHLAEINLGSGLGDVIAELGRGIVIRTKPGAPGIGKIENFDKESVFIGCKAFGKIETSSVIKDADYKKVINGIGSSLNSELLKNLSILNFLKKSYNFALKTNLMNNEVRNAVNILNSDENILGSSMAMLGNTVFAFAKNKESLKHSEVKGLDIYELNNNGVKL